MTPLLSREPAEVLERIAPDLVRPLKVIAREAVESAMILCSGDRDEAAKRLGISRAKLYRMLAAWRKADA
jgi:DNA-binding NtrC family response regulator